jgi:hypothetical protein
MVDNRQGRHRRGICTELMVTEMYEAVVDIMLATGAPTLDDAFVIFTDVDTRLS